MRTSRGILGVALMSSSALLFAAPGCGDSGQGDAVPTDAGVGGESGGDSGADDFYPPVKASDPCLVAGYFFDGESDCNVVRCQELTCECPQVDEGRDPEAPPLPPIDVVLSACVPDKGCLHLADCNRVCDPAKQLTRDACETRIAAAVALGCEDDEACQIGECRQESVGPLCVDRLGCAEDGHCGSGGACLFDPGVLDSDTGYPTSLGACSDGSGGTVCFEDSDCVFGRCEGGRCNDGAEGETCEFNAECAAGVCRKASGQDSSGVCVSGELGSACSDDGDCAEALHCSGGVCFSDAVGQNCDLDEHCASGTCVAGRCQSGTLSARCEDDGDCDDGVCVSGSCVSGGRGSPCQDADDCTGTLRCARQRCTDGSAGSPCSADTDCEAGACVRSTCSDRSLGAECDSDAHCASGRCANPAGVEPGSCTTGAPGAACVYGSHCVSGVCLAGGSCE